nr:hypothetical protein BaRGS_031972 [Batillaria attramentaria]
MTSEAEFAYSPQFFDTSKQAFGAAVIHFANVFLADMFQGDPCTWYFISFLLDSTLGLLVIYLGLKLTQIVAHRYGCKSLYFGEYGEPPKCNAWVGQTGLYIIVMIAEKVLMTFLTLFSFWAEVRKFIMSPIKSPLLELSLVMFVVPLVVNARHLLKVRAHESRQDMAAQTVSIWFVSVIGKATKKSLRKLDANSVPAQASGGKLAIGGWVR